MILEEPENATVCVGQDAVFRSVVDHGSPGWRLNGTPHAHLPDDMKNQIHIGQEATEEGADRLILNVEYNKTFDGLMVQSVAVTPGLSAISESVYVIYKSNQQFPAINPETTANRNAIHVNWQASETMLPKAYYLSILDISATEPVPVTCNDCHNINGTDYHFYPVIDEGGSRCRTFEIRVTEVQPHPECQLINRTRCFFQQWAVQVGTVGDGSDSSAELAERLAHPINEIDSCRRVGGMK